MLSDHSSAMAPLIIGPNGHRWSSYEQAIEAITKALRGNGGRAAFTYNHYSAFDVRITHHTAGAYAVTVNYTGRPAEATVIWWSGGDVPVHRARTLGLNPGHDTDTIAQLLTDLGMALTAEVVASGKERE